MSTRYLGRCVTGDVAVTYPSGKMKVVAKLHGDNKWHKTWTYLGLEIPEIKTEPNVLGVVNYLIKQDKMARMRIDQVRMAPYEDGPREEGNSQL